MLFAPFVSCSQTSAVQRQELGIKISKRISALKGQASVAPPLIGPRNHLNTDASPPASTGHSLTPYISPISPTSSSLVPGHAAAAQYQKLHAALSNLQLKYAPPALRFVRSVLTSLACSDGVQVDDSDHVETGVPYKQKLRLLHRYGRRRVTGGGGVM